MAWEWLSPVVTGAVGIAGILGGAWTASSARRGQTELVRAQLHGESRRAFRADKQALYTRVLSELTALSDNSFRIRKLASQVADGAKAAEIISLADWHSKQISILIRLQLEVAVMAGPILSNAVRQTIYQVSAFADGGNNEGFQDNFGDLVRAMHEDLMADL